jgi:hypothetical protein
MKINLYVQPYNNSFYNLFARNINYREVEVDNHKTYIYILKDPGWVISNLCNQKRLIKLNPRLLIGEME